MPFSTDSTGSKAGRYGKLDLTAYGYMGKIHKSGSYMSATLLEE